jgi:hypothetical protein
MEAATAQDAAQDAALADATVELGPEAWPSSDLVMAEANGNGHGVAWPEDALEQVAEMPDEIAASEIEPEPEPEPRIAQVEPEPEPFTYALEAEEALPAFEYMLDLELEPEPVAAASEPPVHVLAWDDDAAAIEPEPEPVRAEAAPEPEPEPEPVRAEAAPEPEPIPFDRRSYPAISETILPLPRQAPTPPAAEAGDRLAAEIDTETLAARRAQLDMLGLDDPGQGAVERSRPNVLPYRSRGASPGPTDLGRRMAAHGGGTFWDASAREVAEAMSHVGVQSCGQCGLSLSASARFCRRCGTHQARSA